MTRPRSWNSVDEARLVSAASASGFAARVRLNQKHVLTFPAHGAGSVRVLALDLAAHLMPDRIRLQPQASADRFYNLAAAAASRDSRLRGAVPKHSKASPAHSDSDAARAT